LSSTSKVSIASAADTASRHHSELDFHRQQAALADSLANLPKRLAHSARPQAQVILRVHGNDGEGGHNKCHQAHEPNAGKFSPADRSHDSLPPNCDPHSVLNCHNNTETSSAAPAMLRA
jgi:hypothetical protein